MHLNFRGTREAKFAIYMLRFLCLTSLIHYGRYVAKASTPPDFFHFVFMSRSVSIPGSGSTYVHSNQSIK